MAAVARRKQKTFGRACRVGAIYWRRRCGKASNVTFCAFENIRMRKVASDGMYKRIIEKEYKEITRRVESSSPRKESEDRASKRGILPKWISDS